MNDFVRISKFAGMRLDLVQAGGGNTSYKENPNKMYIKASGYQLTDITVDEGYSIVNPKVIIDAFLGTDDIERLNKEDEKKILDDALVDGRKPSIETFLHAISGKYTLHTHPTVVNVLACRHEGMRELKKLFSDAIMIPYATPGVELAKAYFKECNKYKDGERSIVFLQNHGLVVSGNNAREVIERTEEILCKVENFLHIDMKAHHQVTKLWNFFDNQVIWRVTDSDVLRTYKRLGVWEHAICPDCIVYLGKRFMSLREGREQEQIEDFQQKYGQPVIVEYKDNLFVIADNLKKAIDIQNVLVFSANVTEMNVDKDIDYLSETEQNFLLNWDAEKYRRNIK